MFSQNSWVSLTHFCVKVPQNLEVERIYWSMVISIFQKNWTDHNLNYQPFLTLPVAFVRNHCVYGAHSGQVLTVIIIPPYFIVKWFSDLLHPELYLGDNSGQMFSQVRKRRPLPLMTLNCSQYWLLTFPPRERIMRPCPLDRAIRLALGVEVTWATSGKKL